jgi:hypothetical protein
MRRLRAEYRIAASANTILELLLGICRSTSEEHFGDHQERIRIAVGSSSLKSANVLNYPLAIALRCGAQIQRQEDSRGLRRLRDYVEAVFRSRSLHQLKMTGVRFPDSPFLRTLKCSLVEEDLRVGKAWYSGPLNDAKANDLPLETASAWARKLGQFYSVTLDDQQVQGLTSALDAAYEYQKAVWTMSRTGSFKPENNENDWIDMNQLFYLAEPMTVFITEDRKIKERCLSSHQASRIVLLPDLLAQEGLAPLPDSALPGSLTSRYLAERTNPL